MVGDLAALHPHDVDGLELNFTARGRHAEEFAPMRSVIRFVSRHAVTIGKLPMDVGVKVGKRRSEDLVELPGSVFVRRAPRLRRVVQEIVSKKLFEHFEISTTLHLFGVAADDGLCGLADIVGGHDVLQMV
jgi:hypothetical protein